MHKIDSLISLAVENAQHFLISWWQKYLQVLTISANYPVLDDRWSLGYLWLNISRESLDKVRFSHFMANVSIKIQMRDRFLLITFT